MNKGLFKKVLPHLVAVVVFLLVAVIYCRPALEGKVVSQHDITHWKGAIHQSMLYKETHGQYPLWTNSLFSGMPAFQIGYPANNYIPWVAHQVITLWLPTPIQFFFLACICFYFLCMVLKINPYVGMMGALAFAYATYNPVIIAVGHDTKMQSIAYMPALLASIILIYEKRYWLGAALTALFASILIAMNHPQIDYYLFIALGVMTVSYVITWVRQKDFRHLVMAVVFTSGAAIIGVLSNAVTIMSTYEYQKETIRGGGSALSDPNSKNTKSQTGLDKDYAFSYSMGISEPFVLMVPRMFGGSSDHLQVAEEKSKAVEKVRSMPQEAQQFIFQNFSFFGQTEEGELYPNTYWGGIGGVSGPAYVGAIVCFLAILAFFIIDNRYRWWLLAAILLSIIMSWGGYFESFNILLYKYLPLYNKFRAPSMIMVIPQLLLPVLAALGLNKIISTPDKKYLFKKLKTGTFVAAGIFLLLLLMYMSFDFLTQSDKLILKNDQLIKQPQAFTIVKDVIDGLKADRKSLMLGDIFRSFGFAIAALVLVFLFIRNTIKPWMLIGGITVLSLIDVFVIDSIYLNKNNYKDTSDNNEAFVLTGKDKEILADTSVYRVYNMSPNTVSGDPFSENITSYYYNSIGGYHPAKLKIYLDIINKQLAKQQPSERVLDMLNTKYLIQKSPNGQTTAYQKRTTALGPVWFVKNIRFVKNADEEMAALDNFNPKDTAIVQEAFKASIAFNPQPDSSAVIKLEKNDNDVITYQSNAATNQFAVFSEIFYDGGWKAYLDGKEIPIVKVDYVLRGVAVPAGKHEMRFEFKPQGYYKGKKLTSIFSILLLILLAAGIFIEWRKSKKASAR